MRSGRRQHARDAVPDEAGLLGALYFEGEAGYHLAPAAAFVFGGDYLGFGADFGADGDGGRKADLVPTLEPGTYTFYCTVPGHREAGMAGTPTVK